MSSVQTQPLGGLPAVVPQPRHEAVRRVYDASDQSELLHAVASVLADGGRNLALGNIYVRSLRGQEIELLERLGNTADDWSRLRVADDFDPERVRNSHFHGHVVLGCFVRHVTIDGLELPAGIYNSRLANCVIGHDVLVQDVKLLARYVVGIDVVLFDCGSVACECRTAFGNGIALPLGLEGRGREVPIYAEIDVETAAAIARGRTQRDLQEQYAAAVADYTAHASSPVGIIEHGAIICHTPRIKNTYVGPCAQIDGPTRVVESTLLSSHDEPVRITAGACVQDSLLQWGSRVETLAVVERSVLVEHSHAARHAKVLSSLLGPNTCVAEGEVTASLVGPFVNSNHQALLIAAFWPEGKGNISHGANVGSNHTGKSPDQEIRPGEGAFLGLGVNIRFPADFSRAPYTLFASGINTMPQRLAFPFSLVNTPAASYPNISTAYNEIFPAWLLSDNLYALRRNEAKYQSRNRARRARFDFDILRPEIVDLMRDAYRRLESVPEIKEVYTDRDIDGLGKNYLLESTRKKALSTYRFFIQYYALLGLKARVRKELDGPAASQVYRLLDRVSDESSWEHARRVLVDEFHILDIVDGLREFSSMLTAVARSVERSKAKDDERGPRIIDDYMAVHRPAHQDPFVIQTWEETRRLQAEVKGLLSRLSA